MPKLRIFAMKNCKNRQAWNFQTLVGLRRLRLALLSRVVTYQLRIITNFKKALNTFRLLLFSKQELTKDQYQINVLFLLHLRFALIFHFTTRCNFIDGGENYLFVYRMGTASVLSSQHYSSALSLIQLLIISPLLQKVAHPCVKRSLYLPS